ncbi:MAG: hypothetical protein OIF32_05715 [Campylobacterales bacterium]|nr:hypothetical protein [Campylobacterales bacterium]
MKRKILLSLALSSFLFASEAKDIKALKQQIKELQETQSLLLDEIQDVRNKVELPDWEYKSVSGLGVAASKVYNSKNKLSIGGYGEMYWKHNQDTDPKNTTEVLRFIPYIGYKFNDWIVMNTEIEFEHGGANDHDDYQGYTIIEFSYVDFLLNPKYNIRVGHVLVPMGNINLNHEPPQYLTTERPTVETKIIPSTWHTNGILSYGNFTKHLSYYAGIVTAPDASKYEIGTFIGKGRMGIMQPTDNYGYTGRLDYTGVDGLNAGFSFFSGNTGDKTTTNVDAKVTMWDIHAIYKLHGLDIKFAHTVGTLGDNTNLGLDDSTKATELDEKGNTAEADTYRKANGSRAGKVSGTYLTAGYNIMPMVGGKGKLYPFYEIEMLDMDVNKDLKTGFVSYEEAHPNSKYTQQTYGLAYYPTYTVVLRMDHTVHSNDRGSGKDQEWTYLSIGYLF